MRYPTHVMTSIAATLTLTHMSHLPFAPELAIGVVVGSLLPDIDENKSYIGRRSGGIARIVKMIFGHRGFTHSILATLLISIPALLTQMPIFIGLALGYLFHILGDYFSVTGVPLFYPSKKKYKIPLYVTGGLREKIIFLLAFGVSVYLFFFI